MSIWHLEEVLRGFISHTYILHMYDWIFKHSKHNFFWFMQMKYFSPGEKSGGVPLNWAYTVRFKPVSDPIIDVHDSFQSLAKFQICQASFAVP